MKKSSKFIVGGTSWQFLEGLRLALSRILPQLLLERLPLLLLGELFVLDQYTLSLLLGLPDLHLVVDFLQEHGRMLFALPD